MMKRKIMSVKTLPVKTMSVKTMSVKTMSAKTMSAKILSAKILVVKTLAVKIGLTVRYAGGLGLLGVLLLSCGGCQLARENVDYVARQDPLIGVFITTEHLDLFDFESYLNENLNANRFFGGDISLHGDTEKYQGRLYATLSTKLYTNEETGEQTETQDYVFEEIEGIPYFAATMPATWTGGDTYTSQISDEAISDGHMSIAERDEGKTVTLEGTIYVAPTAQNRAYYLNPVYQSAEGHVYLMAGTGLSAPMDYEGGQMSQSMESTTTLTENGVTTTESLAITITVSVMSPLERMTILQMDADHTLLMRNVYEADQIPEALTLETNTEYIIVETHKGNGTASSVVRAIYGKEAESITYFMAGADGICVKHWIQLAETAAHPDI